MKLISAFSPHLTIAAAVLLLGPLAHPVRAESDYEYAKQLIALNSPSFSTDDLVERLATRLEETSAPTAKMEGKLIKATLTRRKAFDATPEKRVVLLKEAGELFKDVVAGDRKFRLYDVASKDSDAITMDIITAQLERAKDNPAEAKKLRAEAGAMFEKKANGYKTEAEAAYPAFQAALKRFNDEWDRIDKNRDKGLVPGPGFIDPLNKSFFTWIIPDQYYVQFKLKQVQALDEADAERKKIVTTMVEHCTKRTEDEALGNFPDISARYSYFQGNFHAAVGNEDGAAKSWNDVLEIDLTQQAEDTRKRIIPLIKLVVHDLVKMKMKSKKYSDVEEIIAKIRSGPLRTIFDEDIGKEILIEYAKALTIPAETAAEYEKAVKELRTAIAKERLGSTWSNDFSRAMADALLNARSKKISLRLSAQEWYDAAHGMQLMGIYIYTQQYERLLRSTDAKEKEAAPAKFDEAYKEFSNAVDYYRRAISEARHPERTDLATRLEVEPKCWYEMGLSYIRMKHDYEAIIAYKAIRDTFLPENRAKWLPRDQKAMTPPVKAALATLDLPREKNGMLAKSGSNIMVAIEANEKAHKDTWNTLLRSKIIALSPTPLEPDNPTDAEYIIADGDAKAASVLADNAKKSDKPDVAADNWSQALKKYISAAEKFTKVKAASPVYEFALVQYANNITQAQQIVAENRIPKMDVKEAETMSKDLAQKALDGYQKYEDQVAKNTNVDEKTLLRRKKAHGIIVLAKNSLYIGAGSWAQAVKTADEYIAYEVENPPPPGKSLAKIAYLNKFRALLSLSAQSPAPASDPYLSDALATLRDLRDTAKDDDKLYVFMLNVLSDRYNVAAYQLEKKKKTEAGLPKEEVEKLDDMINKYENKVAELQSERIEIIEANKTLVVEELGLDDYSRLVYLFNKIGQHRKAADAAIKMLKKYDPENKNMKMLDDEKVWRPFLNNMLKTITYESIAKRDRCIKEHSVLVDYMYDTAQGALLPENDSRRPSFDQLNENPDKALAKLESIRNKDGEFKDCPTLKVGPEPGGKPYLAIVEDEIQFRRKISAARDLLSELALVVAKKLNKEGKEEASLEYMKVAKEQIEIIKDKTNNGDSAAIEIKVAEIDIALGKIDDAMNRLNNILPRLDPSSKQYFYVKRLMSELLAEQKKWNEAADYPAFVFVTQGFNSEMVKTRWPDMKAFLKNLSDNGAKMPPALKKIFDAEKAAPDAPKTDAPKPEEPKADAPKVEAPKEPEKKP